MKERNERNHRKNVINLVSSTFLAASLFFLGQAVSRDMELESIDVAGKTTEEIRKINQSKDRDIVRLSFVSFVLALQGTTILIVFPYLEKLRDSVNSQINK